MPWPREDGDLAFFKEMVSDGILIKGSKTWLPKCYDQINVSNSGKTFEEALEAAKETGKPIWVVGGSQIYKLALDYLKEHFKGGNWGSTYITHLPGSYECDTWFPKLEGMRGMIYKECDKFTVIRYRIVEPGWEVSRYRFRYWPIKIPLYGKRIPYWGERKDWDSLVSEILPKLDSYYQKNNDDRYGWRIDAHALHSSVDLDGRSEDLCRNITKFAIITQVISHQIGMEVIHIGCSISDYEVAKKMTVKAMPFLIIKGKRSFSDYVADDFQLVGL